MSELTKAEQFALEEFRALRTEINHYETILDRTLRRAATISFLCFVLVTFEMLPFFRSPVPIPADLWLLLQIAPATVVAVSFVHHHVRYAHLKRIAEYIEALEAVFYERRADTLGWEHWLRRRDREDILLRNSHNIIWFALIVVVSLFTVLLSNESAVANRS